MFEICKKCLMPNTRPETPFKKGICQACINYDTRKNINWNKRLKELKKICNRYKKKNGEWDCILPISGGKDSHSIVYWIKEVMRMNPLLITFGDPFTKTNAGLKNYKNIGEAFNCDQILFTVSPNLAKHLIKIGFEEFLDPLRFIEQGLNTLPFKLAVKLGIKLIMKGESPFVYGASLKEERSALELIHRNFNEFDVNFWLKRGAKLEELNSIIPPSKNELEKLNPEVFFMSYFVPWSSVDNLKIAQRFGFTDLTHEWKREGCMEDFEQIDSKAYLTHIWLKYPKFGFQRVSDIASRRIREGLLSIEDAKKIIIERDHKLDQLALEDFINFIGYSRKEFWDVVEKFWNPEIFIKKGAFWINKTSRF